MLNKNATGLFGKLPAHGDFIYRDLSPTFVNIWDEWLQGYVGSSREQLGDAWLEIYLTSPVWRFAFSEGVIDGNSWAGIILPSVDRVGRYFPFTVVACLPQQANPVDFVCSRQGWYQAMEDAALKALYGQLQLEGLVEELNDINPMVKSVYIKNAPLEHLNNLVIKNASVEQAPQTILPYMLDACLVQSLKSYSVWSTKGSELIEPCMFVSKGLPQLGGIAAMMDGQWAQRNWQEPFTLKAR
ncbi:MAG: type VI secretion system protein ImpM [Lentisphaeria bacterium]|jgi:type VI secretion system protein ImpM